VAGLRLGHRAGKRPSLEEPRRFPFPIRTYLPIPRRPCSAPLKAQRPKLYHSFDLIADGASLKKVPKDPARIAV
jgi:hypothetical protein